MEQYFEFQDLSKALLSLLAGFILGLERELKDKSAGLKTITIICLGSALFTIISVKIATGDADPGRIAANISTGIGFLGAGVIFKEGFSVYGLTTAGIIWIAAAIGMAIGFGQPMLGFIFLFCALIVIYLTKALSHLLLPSHLNKMLKVSIAVENYHQRDQLVKELSTLVKNIDQTSTQKSKDGAVELGFEVHILEKQLPTLERYLIENTSIKEFQL